MTPTVAAFGVGLALGGFDAADRRASARAAAAGLALAVAALAPVGPAAPAALAGGAALALLTAAALMGIVVGALLPTERPAVGAAALVAGASAGVASLSAGMLQVALPIADADGMALRGVAAWSAGADAWTRTVIWSESPTGAAPLVAVTLGAFVVALVTRGQGTAAGRWLAWGSSAIAVFSGGALCALAAAGVGLPTALPVDLPPPSGPGAMSGSPFMTGGTPAHFVVPQGWIALTVAGAVLWAAAVMTRRGAAPAAAAPEARPTWIPASVAGVVASGVLALSGIANADPAWWTDPVLGGALAVTLLIAGAGWMGALTGPGRDFAGALVAFVVAAGVAGWTVIA